MRHALFKHFMSNEHAYRNKSRSWHSTCQKLICDMRNMTAWQHDSMTGWQGDISWQEVTSHSYKPDTHNQRDDRAATAQSDDCRSPHVPPCPMCPLVSMCQGVSNMSACIHVFVCVMYLKMLIICMFSNIFIIKHKL